MNNPFAREPAPSEGYDDWFSEFPPTSQSRNTAPSDAGQTFYGYFRELIPTGESTLQSVRQQPLPNMTSSYSPMLDSMPRHVPAFQAPSHGPLPSESDWIGAYEEDGPMEPSRFGDPDFGPDECSTYPPLDALGSERYTSLAPYQRYSTNVPDNLEESFADANGNAADDAVSPPTASHSTLVKPPELSSLGKGLTSESEFPQSRPRRGLWDQVLKTVNHSKTVYLRGYLDVAPLYEIEDDGIVPSVDSLAAFARKYGSDLRRWAVTHLTVHLNNPTGKDGRYERRKGRELYCGQVLSDWYEEELQTANERDLKTLQSWKKSTISEVFEAKAGTPLADLFSWDRLRESLTRFGRESPERMIGGYPVTFSEGKTSSVRRGA